MIDIGNKTDTLRIARAQSTIRVSPETILRVKSGDLPKKNVLEVAQTAGVMAAKKTPDLIPYCHPLPLDGVTVELKVEADRIEVEATVQAIWKTGVEMEALTAASVTALTLYDMLKPIDQGMEITGTKLVSKKGGKGDFHPAPPKNFRAAIIVTSDGTAAGKREDKSGAVIRECLERLKVNQIEYCILPDELHAIREQILNYCESGADLVVTTGGTGLGPRDVTVEATQELIEREMPAVMQAVRNFGQRRTPYAMLSRGLAGVRGKTVILNLPGSSRGARESMDAIFPALFHVYPMLNGGGH